MEIIIPILIFGLVIRSVLKKAVQSEAEQRRNGSPAARQAQAQAQVRAQAQARAGAASRGAAAFRPASSYTVRSAQNTRPNTLSRDGRVYASIDFDNTHYHAEGFDFDCCISFKGLPPGTDELKVLIASNTRHEKELERLLHTTDRNFTVR